MDRVGEGRERGTISSVPKADLELIERGRNARGCRLALNIIMFCSNVLWLPVALVGDEEDAFLLLDLAALRANGSDLLRFVYVLSGSACRLL